ncbi:Ig-like domain-containing protein [Catenovulum sp. 2E275]|uniref:Ig-like domain-containing protein n=1 Tax=Catenovulum sp. 2E275 TaxID=2980497 RepID=UPI0021D1F39A|nr:Ig-like domain-containing protein [Catenovulum sp. 2E275]MCU4677473.1 Ig-like domain-containing protein [Catenovulum sp. 2E275]
MIGKLFASSLILAFFFLLPPQKKSYAEDGVGVPGQFYNYEFDFYDINKGNYVLTPYDHTVLGEKIDESSGRVKFEYIDINIPGNFDIEVAFRRTYSTSTTYQDKGWSLPETPRLEFQVVGYGPKAVASEDCTKSHIANPIFISLGEFGSGEGYFMKSYKQNIPPNLIIPGKINESLHFKNETLPYNGSGHIFTTASKWVVSCVTSESSSGSWYEAVSPKGVRYTFDTKIVANYSHNEIKESNKTYEMYRVNFYASKVEDRFGNWVKYNRNIDGLLTSITSSDNRNISIGYINNKLTTATANGKTWLYDLTEDAIYSTGTVTRPDGKQWIYNLQKRDSNKYPNDGLVSWCDIENIIGDKNGDGDGVISNKQGTDTLTATPTITIQHPDGAVGKFWLGFTTHGTAKIDPKNSGPIGNIHTTSSRCSYFYSLLKKSVSGTGVPESIWRYEYSLNEGYYRDVPHDESYYNNIDSNMMFSGEIPRNINNYDYKWTKIIRPDNSYITRYFNRDAFSYFKNKLFAEIFYNVDGTPLKEVLYNYEPGTFYASDFVPTETNLTSQNSQKPKLVSKKVTIFEDLKSNTYTTDITSFGDYDYPLTVEEYNDFSSEKKYKKYTYKHDTLNWIFGLPEKTYIGDSTDTYELVNNITYYASTHNYSSLPYSLAKHGLTYKLFNSYTLGNPRRVSEILTGRWFNYSNYKRGIPQTIVRPSTEDHTDTQYATQTINDDGFITKQYDFEGECIEFDYDLLGRITLVSPCNTYWNNINISYESVSTQESGFEYIDVGMLKQSVSRGNSRHVTYYDSFLRPRFTKEWDVSEPNSTMRYTRTDWDIDNKITYQSKPSSEQSTLYGTVFEYDMLKRVVVENDNSVTGQIDFTYHSDNRISKIDNLNNHTITTYLAFGAPNYKLATLIESPESIRTEYEYNTHYNLISITQGGATENLVYNSNQQLCKSVRPDIGNRAYTYNVLGEVTTMVHGASVGSAIDSCDTIFDSSEITAYTYDFHGNLATVSYGDGSPTKIYSHDENDNLLSIVSNGVTNTYIYNDLNQVTRERLQIDGYNWLLAYGYDANSNLSSITYPNGEIVSYSPNALGQATKASNYANNAKYFANGMIRTFTYGNGFIHTVTQHNSGLPKDIYDVRLGTQAFDHYLDFDSNGNLTFLRDDQNSHYTLDLGYDGVNRLNAINDSFQGSGQLSYDTMGNILSYTLGNKNLVYSYDSNKRLESVGGTTNYQFTYDGRGNILTNGNNTNFTYNLAENVITNKDYIRFTYDGQDKRVKKSVRGVENYFFYNDEGKLIFKKRPGLLTNNIYLGKKFIAENTTDSNTGNHPPSAVNDTIKSILEYGEYTTVIYPLVNDSDPDGDRLILTSATGKEVSISSDGTYIIVNSLSDQTITYTISDGNGGISSANISLDITIDY